MVYQKITADTFSQIIMKMINYNKCHKTKAVEFDDIQLDKKTGRWKTTVRREGSLR